MTPEYIILTVCKALDTNRDEIFERKVFFDARLIAIYLIRQHITVKRPITGDKNRTIKIPYTEIAELFNRKQHGTIMYAEIECKNLIKIDKNFKAKYEKVIKILNNG